MFKDKVISLITTCKEREIFLALALTTWVKLPFDEIIIVDWSSPGNIQSIIDLNQNGKIQRIRVEGKKGFNLGKARNAGYKVSTGYFLFFCDCDILLSNKLFQQDLSDSFFYTRSLNLPRYFSGTCFCTRAMYDRINGYDEGLWGYGYEDNDFYKRLSYFYSEKHLWDKTMMSHLDHSSDLRYKYYAKNLDNDNYKF